MVMYAGFEFDGKHNTDMDVTLSGDIQVGYPDKIKNRIRVTGTNTEYDFSETNGVQQWTNRIVTAPINILDFDRMDYRSSQLVATRVFNWLMRPNERVRLVLDKFPDFYFMGEVVNGPDFQTDLFEIGEAEVEFDCYAFKIRERASNSDEFATFNFMFDVRQQPEIALSTMEDQLPFNLLNVGDVVNIGGWGQYFAVPGNVTAYHMGQSFTIDDIREVDDVDPSVLRFDKTQYYLREINTWVRSQALVQARPTYGELELFNGGIHPVTPEIKLTHLNNRIFLGATIEKNGRLFNIRKGEPNRRFTLDPGENKLKIYGADLALEFIWHDEVI